MPFPPKPDRLEDFDKPVSWLVGRDLLAGLKWIVLYSAFKGKLDPRDWMKASVYPPKPPKDSKTTVHQWWRDRDDENWNWKVSNDEFWRTLQKEKGDFWKRTQETEFWFDYIADSGDGQVAVYDVAYLCFSDLWTQVNPGTGATVKFEHKKGEHEFLLPRGQFLFVGGDTAYHIADYTSLSERFQIPFRWAFAGVRHWLKRTKRLSATVDKAGRMDEDGGKTDSEPARPIFGIPGNHDYYDFLDGFNRQFRRSAFEEHGKQVDHPQLSVLGFERYQNASYAALQLPFDWWLWALDTEVSKLDARQQCFFLDLLDPERGWLDSKNKEARDKAIPKKLILATPEPATVFRKRIEDSDKTLEAYEQLGLEQPFKAKADGNGKCRLDISGDVHHYARYYGPNTKNLPDQPMRSSDHYASVVSGGGGAFLHPSETRWTGDDAIEEQVLYPTAKVSHSEVAKQLFDLRNIFNGGYVWLFGSIVAGVVYFALTIPRTSKDFLEWVLQKHCDASGKYCIDPTALIPFVPDSDLRGLLPELGRINPISLKGFVVATVLLLLTMGFLGAAAFIFSGLVKRLTSAPSIGLREAADRLPTEYRDLWPVGLFVLLGLASYLIGIWICLASLNELHPFGGSLIILIHIVIGVELLILSVQNSAWLAHRPRLDTGNKFRFLPVWTLTVLACLFVFFGIWAFGRHPGAYILSDATFALVVVGLLVALTLLGAFKGGELQRWPGKVFMGIVGLWHAILQLSVALVLIRVGDWRAVVAALIVVLIFSGLSIPYTKISIQGVGAHAMRNSPVVLTILWFIYGAILLALPLVLNSERGVIQLSGTERFSSFLPQPMVDWFGVSNASAWTLEIISLISAVLLGFLFSMSLLSWYFGVSMAFQGHNNEVGGAGRIERFRHIVRICLTEKDLTAYVIAFDDPKVDGHTLKLKLVDKFTLKAT
jgi:hypothetical protein